MEGMDKNEMTVVYANSLAAITSLAAGPPSNPRQQPPSSIGQLTLYIAKVPGSKDVFLTPLKPREKVVTVEDIQSSLYYLHVHSAEDGSFSEASRAPVSSQGMTMRIESGISGQHHLGSRGVLPNHPLPPLPTDVPESLRPGRDQRQYTGSRSYTESTHFINPHDGQTTNDRISANSFAVRRKPVSTVPKLHVNTQSYNPDDSSSTRYNDDEQARAPSSHDQSEGTRITVIRRDPSSSQQWNVATVFDPLTYDIGSQMITLRRKGQPIYLELESPGYTRFVAPDHNGTPQHASRFQRRLHMEGAILDNATLHRKSISTETATLAPPLRPEVMSRASFDSSLESWSSQSAQSLGSSMSSGVTRSKTRNYTFTSPWNTRCEFIPGAGHSMKCRHSLPDASRLGGVDPVQISELRFNLPGGGPLASPTEQEHVSSSRRSRFLGRRKLSEEDVYPGEDTSNRLDLMLGKEMAGGGFAGKQAKLGKLIIEPEGIKMLDLLVTANMALWWRAYDKT